MEESSPDEENFACDCIAARLHEALPGAPAAKAGIIPYNVVYESQEDARRQGYWIPGVPVTAKITKVERDTKFGLHLINAYLYTVELQHGLFKWSVVKRNKDFAVLAARLLTHRAAERIRAPVRRAKEAVDDALESVGVDIIPDREPSHRGRHRSRNKMQTLSRAAEGLEPETSARSTDRTADSDRDKSLDDSMVKSVFQTAASRPGTIQKKADGSGDVEQHVQISPTTPTSTTEPSAAQITAARRNWRRSSSTRGHQLPTLRLVPDSVGNPDERREELEAWLQAALHIPVNRNHHETAEFLEVSRFSFVNEMGGKYAEGKVKKRPGGGRVFIGCKQFCVRHCVSWSKRWLILKDSFVCYMDPRSEVIRFVLLFDGDFEVNAGPEETQGMASGLVISNQQHELALLCDTPLDAFKWKTAIEESINGVGKIWRAPHPYGSSFPVRKSAHVQWFVDGREYMEHAANMMELAREEIFIADWWLSPEIYMKRPLMEGSRWRLDEILKRKAEQGVRVFVLLYKEMEMALGINSIYTKRTLQALHKNIKVLRHPDHYLASGTFFWAHHEKLVIVDQLIAFVGGVDLCYGRWDDHRHKLIDLGSVQYSTGHAIAATKDFSVSHGLRALAAASATLSPLGLEEHEEVGAPANTGPPPRSPGAAPLEGIDEVDESTTQDDTAATKKRRSFVAMVARRSKSTSGDRPKRVAKLNESADADTSGVTETSAATERHHRTFPTLVKRSLSAVHRQKSHVDGPPIEMVSVNVEKMDLPDALTKYKAYVESGKAAEAKHKAEKKSPPAHRRSVLSRVARNLRPTAKKHLWKKIQEETGVYDISYMQLHNEDEQTRELEVGGASKLWVGKDYVNFIYKDFVELDMPFHDFIDRGVMPRMPWHDIHAVTYGASARDLARHFIQRWNVTKTEKAKDLKEYPFLLPKCYDNIAVPRVLAGISEAADVQVLRSVSRWSALINRTEESIQQAYLSLISNAQHYIYIENQFFVSMIGGTDVHNEICKVLCERIIRAHKHGENFKVYIMLPLMPGFEGDVGAPGGSALQAVLHWTFRSLCRGPNSLFENLKKAMPDPLKYVHVGSVRTYDLLCGKLVSELIYIHSKLMIVDDSSVIIGSANINDRSQSGNRDSEVCIVVKDTTFVPSTMGGKPYEAGRFASSLRKHLMMEHLGMLPGQKQLARAEPPSDIDLDDPLIDSFFFDKWGAIAKANTKIYEEVFHVYPTDYAETFDELHAWTTQLTMAEATPQLAEEKLRDLVGNLVEFPLNFLRKANLAPGIASKEGLVPTSVFT